MSLLLITACSSKPAIIVQGIQLSEETFDQGKTIDAQFCASCHGANGAVRSPESKHMFLRLQTAGWVSVVVQRNRTRYMAHTTPVAN
jgi:mono/diheme cytochrome c family protein